MTAKQKQARKDLIKERVAAKKAPVPQTQDDFASAKADAYRLENEGKWDEAAIAWSVAADCAASTKDKKTAAGRLAAAKVRASAAAKALEAQMEEQATKQAANKPNPIVVRDATPEEIADHLRVVKGLEDGSVQPIASDDAETDENDDETRAATSEEMAAEAAAEAALEGAKKEIARESVKSARLPPVGTVIVKKDRLGAERCRCKVVEGGVEYAGAVYKTISAAAMAAARDLKLNSKSQDGYAFWGLKKGAAPPSGSKARAEAEAAYADAIERYGALTAGTQSPFPDSAAITPDTVARIDLIVAELRAIAAGLASAKKLCAEKR